MCSYDAEWESATDQLSFNHRIPLSSYTSKSFKFSKGLD